MTEGRRSRPRHEASPFGQSNRSIGACTLTPEASQRGSEPTMRRYEQIAAITLIVMAFLICLGLGRTWP